MPEKILKVTTIYAGIPDDATDNDIAEFIGFQIIENIDEIGHNNPVYDAYSRNKLEVKVQRWSVE